MSSNNENDGNNIIIKETNNDEIKINKEKTKDKFAELSPSQMTNINLPL